MWVLEEGEDSWDQAVVVKNNQEDTLAVGWVDIHLKKKFNFNEKGHEMLVVVQSDNIRFKEKLFG